MKKLGLWILIIMLAILPINAEAAPAAARLVINGVSAAFFAEDGSYLPLVKSDGAVYAPAEQLGEYLGLDISVDTDKNIVRINGIPAAFLTDEGTYLAPIPVEGVVYVPVVSFASAAGIPCTVDENSVIRLEKTASAATATPEPTAAPQPTPQPTPVPTYGYVLVDENNFTEFFDFEWEMSSDELDYKRSSFSIYFTITISPRYGFTAENMTANVSIGSYCSTSIPVNLTGRTVKTVKAKTIYKDGSDKDYIMAQADAKMLAIFTSARLDSVSGRLKMSWAEAEQYNSKDYDRALKSIENKSYSLAIDILSRLAKADYRDSKAQLNRARTEQRAYEAQKAEEKAARQSSDYDAAMRAIAEGDPEKAKSLLTSLAKENYRDSKAQLENAEALIRANTYAEAESLLAQHEYEKAAEKFDSLGDYSDSALRTKETKLIMAQALEQEGKTDEALAAYDALKDYEPAQEAANKLHHKIAEAYRASADYVSAADEYALAGEDTAQKECLYIIAEQYAASADWEKAAEYYGLASGYEDALTKYNYYLAVKEENSGNPAAAMEAYKNAVPYLDSEQKYTEMAFKTASHIMISGGMIVIDNTDCGAVDLSGNLMVPFGKYSDINAFSEDGIAIANDSGLTYIDRNGNKLIDKEFAQTNDFHNGRAAVQYSGDRFNYYYIDTNGDEIQNDAISSIRIINDFCDGFAAINYFENNVEYAGLIDVDGNVKVKKTPQEHTMIEKVGNGANGYFSVGLYKGRDHIVAVYNKSGKTIIDYGTYEYVKLPGSGDDMLIAVRKPPKDYREGSENTWGYADINGKVIIKPQYYKVSLFRNGAAFVKKEGDDTYSMIDAQGNIIKSGIDKYAQMGNGLIAVACGGGKIINARGEVILDGIDVRGIDKYVNNDPNLFAAKLESDGCWHLFNAAGEDLTKTLLRGEKSYEELFPEPEDTSIGTVTILANSAVRASKDFSSAAAGYVNSEAAVKFYEFDGEWYLIELEDGTRGYVYNSRCKN